jgi:hypothetical protein
MWLDSIDNKDHDEEYFSMSRLLKPEANDKYHTMNIQHLHSGRVEFRFKQGSNDFSENIMFVDLLARFIKACCIDRPGIWNQISRSRRLQELFRESKRSYAIVISPDTMSDMFDLLMSFVRPYGDGDDDENFVKYMTDLYESKQGFVYSAGLHPTYDMQSKIWDTVDQMSSDSEVDNHQEGGNPSNNTLHYFSWVPLTAVTILMAAGGMR